MVAIARKVYLAQVQTRGQRWTAAQVKGELFGCHTSKSIGCSTRSRIIFHGAAARLATQAVPGVSRAPWQGLAVHSSAAKLVSWLRAMVGLLLHSCCTHYRFTPDHAKPWRGQLYAGVLRSTWRT